MGIRNNIGHGAMGLRSGLRDFVDLIDFSDSEKTVVVELQPVQEISGWSPDEDGAFIAAFDFSFDGIRRDVIDVRTLENPTLTRVETLDEVRATEGTFFYDPEQEFPPSGLWDDGVTLWDDGITSWDQFTQITIHLPGGADPNETTVVAVHSFDFAPKGIVHPQFGPSKLINGTFETFVDQAPFGWDFFEATGLDTWDSGDVWDALSPLWDALISATPQETELPFFREGKSAICINVGTSQTISLSQILTDQFIVGKQYRFYGAYRTEGDVSAEIAVSADLATPGDSLFVDGRTVATGTNNFIPLKATGGEWRRFSFDFIAFDTTLEFLLRTIGGGTSGGSICWDDVDVRKIWSFNYFEPRVLPSAIPETRVGSHDVFFGRKNIGVGSVKLINSDGFFYKLVPQLDWMNQNIIVQFGGEFPPQHPSDSSQEILFEDYERTFTGLIQEQTLNDQELANGIQDLRQFFHSILPEALYDVKRLADMDPRLQGSPRPLLFGEKANITPNRIGFSGGLDYGKYEIANTTNAPAGIASVDQVFAYADAQAATNLDTARRLLLAAGPDYTVDLALGQITILVDVGPFIVTAENNIIEWTDSGTNSATVPSGAYTAPGLAAAIEAVMEPVTGNDYSVTYDNTTHKFTIARLTGAGAFDLLTKTGASKEIGVWPLIGFSKSADKTGATSYLGDEVVFDSADSDHILRVDAKGFKDNSAGQFTGTPGGLIDKGPDILRVILLNYMKRPEEDIDEASFLDARINAPEELALYINRLTSTKNIFDGLEFSNAANIIVDADGKVFYKVNVSAITGPVLEASDREIQRYEDELSVSDIYQTIRVSFDQDPTTGVFLGVEESEPSVVVRFGRTDNRTFDTFIKRANDARDLAVEFLGLATNVSRKMVVTLLGGKFIRLDIGDKINININAALDPTGAIVNKTMRIISIRKQPQTGRVNLELTDN